MGDGVQQRSQREVGRADLGPDTACRPGFEAPFPRVRVQNRSISQLSDTVYAAPAADGSWWLWWSWADQLAPIDDVDAAAFKIAYVLTPA